jgi:cytochrome c oxidase subunit IV
MNICINCGVELEEGLKKCPLCGRNPGERVAQDLITDNKPSNIINLQKKENLRYLWELFTIIAFSGISVCTILDLLISKGLRWSLFSDISIIAAWIIITLFLFARRRRVVIIPSLAMTILTSLFLIDLIHKGIEWFLPVGLPVTLSLFVAVGIITILYEEAHLKGLNIVAAGLIVLSSLSIITEFVLDKYLHGDINMRWSLITSVSILPVALILVFYHYRLKKGNRLDSFFHV